MVHVRFNYLTSLILPAGPLYIPLHESLGVPCRKYRKRRRIRRRRRSSKSTVKYKKKKEFLRNGEEEARGFYTPWFSSLSRSISLIEIPLERIVLPSFHPFSFFISFIFFSRLSVSFMLFSLFRFLYLVWAGSVRSLANFLKFPPNRSFLEPRASGDN